MLAFDRRSKTCKKCEYYLGKNQPIPEHNCQINWTGSSKAMEADMAVEMARRLKDNGCEIKGLYM